MAAFEWWQNRPFAVSTADKEACDRELLVLFNGCVAGERYEADEGAEGRTEPERTPSRPVIDEDSNPGLWSQLMWLWLQGVEARRQSSYIAVLERRR